MTKSYCNDSFKALTPEGRKSLRRWYRSYRESFTRSQAKEIVGAMIHGAQMGNYWTGGYSK